LSFGGKNEKGKEKGENLIEKRRKEKEKGRKQEKKRGNGK
jgi:hypothetical protein